MHRIREILRQKWNLNRTHREVAASVGCGVGTVSKVLERATAAGLDIAIVDALADDELESRVQGVRPEPPTKHEPPDFAAVHREHARPGVTLQLLHLEYLAKHPDGYRYTQFCELYRRWLGRRRLSMRQVHRAGEKGFVDYAGQRPYLVDPRTGECLAVELFVMVLGASNLTYAEATLTQRGPDFIASHVRAYEYFGGVPIGTVCDQLRSGVSKPCRYEPVIQRTYEAMAVHYGTTVLPARPKHPRDKAKVEVAVQVAERWILARLRNEEFATLAAANELSAGSLSWWAWKLRSEGQDVPGGRPERRGQPKARSRKRSKRSDAPSFIEVAAIPQASRGGGIEIEASGMVIRAEVGFDEAHLARVLAAVEARR